MARIPATAPDTMSATTNAYSAMVAPSSALTVLLIELRRRERKCFMILPPNGLDQL
jgi:hypothetical protein